MTLCQTDENKTAPLSEWNGVQRDAISIYSQMWGAPKPAVEVIAPCVVGAHDAARKLTADGAGVF